jgi:5-methylcytosine-specific restriction protein A
MSKLPFIPELLYKRSGIHDQFGGNRQAGISSSAKFPYIFIFSGKTGTQYGYKDGWDNPNVFTYTGEGQIGDMRFTKGNLALRDHGINEQRVFLFEYESSGYVRFVSELEFYDYGYEDTHDKNQNIRVGIKFFLKKAGISLPIIPDEFKLTADINATYKIHDLILPNKTERSGLVTSRIGQGAYRTRIILRWDYKCAVTGFNNLDILIASHIVPWSKATDQERLDVHNGLLLSPTYDALFDQHLISFDNRGKIILSNFIDQLAFNMIGVTGTEKIKNLSQYNQSYLNSHRESIK